MQNQACNGEYRYLMKASIGHGDDFISACSAAPLRITSLVHRVLNLVVSLLRKSLGGIVLRHTLTLDFKSHGDS